LSKYGLSRLPVVLEKIARFPLRSQCTQPVVQTNCNSDKDIAADGHFPIALDSEKKRTGDIVSQLYHPHKLSMVIRLDGLPRSPWMRVERSLFCLLHKRDWSSGVPNHKFSERFMDYGKYIFRRFAFELCILLRESRPITYSWRRKPLPLHCGGSNASATSDCHCIWNAFVAP